MSLLQSEPGILYYPTLAKRTSVTAAIMAQQIYFWQCRQGVGRVHEGQRWIYNSYEEWADQTGLTVKQVRAAVILLESIGAIETKQLDRAKHDQTKFYRVKAEHEVFIAPKAPDPTSSSEGSSIWLEGQTDLPCGADGESPEGRCLKTEITPETTSNNKSIPFGDLPAPVKRGRSRAAEPPELVAMAEQLHKIIADGIAKQNIPHGALNLDPQATARELRLLRSDSQQSPPREIFEIEELAGLLAWAWTDRWQDGTCYGSVLLSPAKWRNRPPGGGQSKIGRAYGKWLAQGKPAAAKATSAPPFDPDKQRPLPTKPNRQMGMIKV